MTDPDVRWKQRFDNFKRAFALLESATADRALESFSDLEQEGLVQRFEYTYELAWKTMKDYLEASGIDITPITPRNVLKSAFSARIVDDGQIWIDMMLHRNMLSHTYDSKRFEEVLKAVYDRYLNAFRILHDWFENRLGE